MVEDPVVEAAVAAAAAEVDLEVAPRVLHHRRLDLPAHLALKAAQAAQAAQEGVVAQGIPAPRGKLPKSSPLANPDIFLVLPHPLDLRTAEVNTTVAVLPHLIQRVEDHPSDSYL